MSKNKGTTDKEGEEGPASTSTLTSPNQMEENEELERATVEKYRRMYKNTDTSMIVYRMNAWRRKKEEEGVYDNPEDKILDNYAGRIDFGVDRHKANPSYILSKAITFRKRAPVPPEYVVCVSEHNKVSYDHCVIKAADYPIDQIWIMEEYNNEHDGTFVNGERIPKEQRYRLVDGDIIGLGAPHDSPEHWGEDKKKRGFVFKVKNLKSCGDGEQEDDGEVEECSNPVFRALNNNVVLNAILNFLSFSELKSVRLVNQFWKRMADPKIIPRSFVRFESPGESNRYPKCWDPNFLFTSSMAEKYNFPKWEIDLSYEYQAKKFDEKILQILKDKGPFVRDIKLEISDLDGLRFISILRNLPKVETLRVNLQSYKPFPPKSETFPSVRHLWFEGDYREFNDDIMVQLSKLFPNVQKITAGVRLDCVLKQISTHGLWSNGLTEISSRNEELVGADNQQELFVMIRRLPQKLKKLKLLGRIRIDFKNPSEMASLESMLHCPAQTLEYLVLRFQSGMGDYYNREDDEPAETQKSNLRLPTFPKLKTFEFISKNPEDFPFNLMFPSTSGGSICYEQDFPEIQTLRLLTFNAAYRNKMRAWSLYRTDPYHVFLDFNGKPVLDSFIPHESQTVSRTMRWIEFALEDKIRVKGDEWYEGFVERFRQMFPHVHHPHLTHCSEKGEESGSPEEKDQREPTPPPPVLQAQE